MNRILSNSFHLTSIQYHLFPDTLTNKNLINTSRYNLLCISALKYKYYPIMTRAIKLNKNYIQFILFIMSCHKYRE